jgi:capsular polysaccharide biosynthesis protein
MKTWIAWATRLYPAAWRNRYGSEFHALLEDVNPGWRELFDVLGGAIKMQLTNGAIYLKLGTAFALAGLLVATIASFVIPTEYTSTAVLAIANTDELARAEPKVLGRTSLSAIIQDPALQLYPSERSDQPLEDVIEFMRRSAIHIAVLPDHHTVRVSFRYTDKRKAQAVVRVLIARLSQALQLAHTSQNLEIVDPPSLPLLATSPKRFEILTSGLTAGLLIGLIAALFVKHTRRAIVFATLGFVGCLLGAAISFLIPDRYISTAVIRIRPYDRNLEQAVKALERPGLGIRVRHLNGEPGAAAVEFSFEDTDPKRARAGVEATISMLVNRRIAKLVETRAVAGMNLEILDNANLPLSPAFPNRMVISLLGLGGGFVAGAITLLIQHRSTPKLA